jgi:penicillin-binding protein activator
MNTELVNQTDFENSKGTWMKKPIFAAAIFISIVITFYGCSSNKTVTRIDPSSTTDLSGDWNDTDSRLVANEMIGNVLSERWLSEFESAQKKNPTVIVGTIRNRTSEHIQTITFVKDLEKALINSGKVEFVASKEEREEVRDERQDQQDNASDESVKKFRQETGADFMLRGDITTIIDQAGGEKVKYYQVNLELVNIETNKKVWIGDKKIKKLVSQSGSKF